MKTAKISNSMLLGLTLLLATSTWAANKSSSNKRPLKVAEPITVNGIRLAKGSYQVKWEGTGPDVELNIVQSNRIVATVPARLVDLSHPEKYEGYGTRMEEDGSVSLTAIYFAGKNYDLEIGQPSPVAESTKDGK
jgi:hypothetical protein